MWQDSDYKEIFQNYQPSPPGSVWDVISKQLSQNNPKSGNWFNHSQKYALIAATVASIFLSAYMTTFIEQDHPVAMAVEKGTIAQNPIIQEGTTTMLNETKRHSSIQSTYTSQPSFILKSTKTTTHSTHHIHSLPPEAKPFQKEIAAILELDLQIEKLSKEIQKDEQLIQLAEQRVQLNHTEIVDAESLNNAFLSQRLAYAKNNAFQNEISAPPAAEVKNSLWKALSDKLYFTPYFGTNLSQVSYQGTPDNPYFSRDAQFEGKLGYNVGTQVGFQFSKRWSIESGIGFGQYILSFNEKMNNNTLVRNGIMYIDQLDFPLMMRYSIPLGNKMKPFFLSFKGGLIYNSVTQYQINYADQNLMTFKSDNTNIDADKRYYNSLQMGYIAGMDVDAFLSKKFSLNLSLLNSLVSQLENFPTFHNDLRRPIQFSTMFSIGTKIRF